MRLLRLLSFLRLLRLLSPPFSFVSFFLLSHISLLSGSREIIERLPYNELSTYAAEMFSKFVMGNESLDNFAKYQDNLKALGLDTVLQLQTTALERYNSRVQ